jgi:hypothetical protein
MYELQVGDRVVEDDDPTAGTITQIEQSPNYPDNPFVFVVWDDDPDRVPRRCAAHELDRATNKGKPMTWSTVARTTPREEIMMGIPQDSKVHTPTPAGTVGNIVGHLAQVVPHLRPAVLAEIGGIPTDDLREGAAVLREFAAEIGGVADLIEAAADRRPTTLDEASRRIGHRVVYRPAHGGPSEDGVITSVNDRYVLVRYGADRGGRATDPARLEFLPRSVPAEADDV